MKTVISAKLKLNTTPEQSAQLHATQLAYRDALNFVSKYAFEHGKMSNKVSLQDGTYSQEPHAVIGQGLVEHSAREFASPPDQTQF